MGAWRTGGVCSLRGRCGGGSGGSAWALQAPRAKGCASCCDGVCAAPVVCVVRWRCEGAQRRVSQTRRVGRVVALEHRAHARAAGKPQRRHVGGAHSLAATLGCRERERMGQWEEAGKEKKRIGVLLTGVNVFVFLFCFLGCDGSRKLLNRIFFPKVPISSLPLWIAWVCALG